MNRYDPSQRSLPEMEQDLIMFSIESEKLGLEWASAASLYDQLEDLKKVVLSEAMSLEGSVAQREYEALKSEPYKNHLAGLAEARKNANMARVKYHASQAKYEALRTILSNKREMLKRGME